MSAIVRTSDPEVLLAGLNPAFVARHAIVPVAIVDSRLTVAMRDCADVQAIAALRFATGLDIDAVPIALGERARRSRAAGDNPSLAAQLRDRLGLSPADETLLAPLRLLLEAGYGMETAGQITASATADPRLRELGGRLAAGEAPDSAFAAMALLPWSADAFTEWVGQGRDPAAFIVAAAQAGPLAQGRRAARRLVGSAIALAVPIAVAARMLPTTTVLALAMLTIVLVACLRLVLPVRSDNDFVRAEVLVLAARLARLPLASPSAVGAARARLAALTGTADHGDGERSGLADALALPPLPRALLLQGELGVAAERSGAWCLAMAERRADRWSWALRCTVIAAFGTALVLMVV